jgi:hypothetical protein
MYRAMLMGALVSAVTFAPLASAGSRVEEFSTVLSGFNEVGALNAQSGAILSDGKATLQMRLNRADQTIAYVLNYSGLGTAVSQAHIHFGKVHMAGGVMVYFCSNLPNPPAGTQPCPASGTVSGMFTAASVIGPTAQGVTAGDFQALVDALESETAYANIHTTAFPAGEIRGEIRRGFSFGLHGE